MNTVQPIRSKKKINDMKNLLKGRSERDYMLFLFGINCGLRVSDILTLTVDQVYDTDHVTIYEKKTGKRKRFLLNKKMQREIKDYVDTHDLDSYEYMFPSRKGEGAITRVQAYRILSEAAHSVGIKEAIGTHTMRKTFGYHHYKKYHDVAMLQNIFNHSAPSITLRYIGISDEEIDDSLQDFFL